MANAPGSGPGNPTSDAPPSPHTSGSWQSLHLWEIQGLRDAMLVLAVVGVLYLGYLASVVTVPLLLAMALAYLFEPVVRRMTRVSWISRPGAALLIIAAVTLLIAVPLAVGLVFAIVQGLDFVGRMATILGKVSEVAADPQNQALREGLPNDFWRSASDFYIDRRRELENFTRSDLSATIAEWLKENAAAISARSADVAVALLGGVASAMLLLFTGFLTAFFFFFMSTGYGRVLEFWESMIPDRKRGRVIYLLGRMDRVIAGFVRGRLTIGFILAVVFSAAYWAIGVPAPLIVGLVIGLLSIVPYVSLIGIPLAMLLMVLEPGGPEWQNTWWWTVLAPVGVYAAVQALDDYVLTPAIQGQATGMDTPTILFASLAGGALAGIYGVLLAIPVAACIKILLVEIVWPRFKEWTDGRAADPLPIGERNKQ